MELRHLRYFVAVAEGENVSRAAAKLRVSQPGVSQQVRDLEAELGFPLLARRGKTVRLTEAGRVFLQEARDILARAAAAVEKARATLAPPVEIHVGHIASGTAEILSRALQAIRVRFPKVQVVLHDLFAEEIPPLLLQRKLDVALAVGLGRLPRELARQELARDKMCVVVGTRHPLARSKVVHVSQLAGQPMATYTRKQCPIYDKQLGKMLAAVGCKPRIGSEHDSGSSLFTALMTGAEWGLLLSGMRRVEGNRLRFLQLCPALPPWPIVALWRKDAETETVRAFVNAALPAVCKPRREGNAAMRSLSLT